MMDIGIIKSQFESIGGTFSVSPQSLQDKLSDVHVFLFDWDGVFNDGMKYGDKGSPFGEADSMGVNLLRLSYWLKHGKMPITGIITGATNEGAEYFAKREGLECVVRGFTDKGKAFTELCEKMDIDPAQVAFFFDDVLDLPVARKASVRFLIKRENGPLFLSLVRDQQLCEYISSRPGGQSAVRECCELIMALGYDFNSTVRVREQYGEEYQAYLALRKSVKTVVIKP